MKKSCYTVTRLDESLNEPDVGMKVKDLCRKHGISAATYYNRKAKYGGMSASEPKRTKEQDPEYASSTPVC